jgi:hypothetical protein
MLALTAQRSLPEQLTVCSIQGEQMSVVRHEENFVAENRDAAIRAEFCIAIQAAARRAGIMPERLPGKSVEREDLIGASDIKNAIRRQRRCFQTKVRNRKKPLKLQRRHVGRVDLR